MKVNNCVTSVAHGIKKVGCYVISFLKCGFDAFMERAGHTSAFAALSVLVPAFMVGAFFASMNCWYIYFLLIYCVLLLCFMVSVSSKGDSQPIVEDSVEPVAETELPAETVAEVAEAEVEA